MAGGTIAEFLASVGFVADEKSLGTALAKVAGFGAAIAATAGLAIAGIMRIAESQVALAASADKLGVGIQKLEELGYVAEQTGASTEAVAAALGGLKEKYPHIKDTSVLLERVGQRMAGMNEQAQKLYAKRMGIDPTLIPMLTRDVSELKAEFQSMYAVAGTDARKAAEDSKAFLAEIGKLKTLASMLSKAVGLAFVGRIRQDVEHLRRVIMDNFDKIRRIFTAVIAVVLRIAGAIGAFVYRVIKWVSALVGWYDKLDDSTKTLVLGAAALLAAWKLLNLGFLATPLGMIVAGLAAIVALVDDYQTYMEGGESLLDWGPLASSIEACLAALKQLWAVVSTVGSAILATLGPALTMINEQCRWILNTIFSLGKILWKVFTGDFSGALDEARAMFADWAASGRAIVAAFCDMVAAFFGTLWAGVSSNFPDLVVWAANSAKGIVDFFRPALDWLKEKLHSLTGLLPDWLRGKLGLGGGDDAKATPPPVANVAPPAGPQLMPSHAQAAQIDNSQQREVKIDAKTQIVVNGAQDPGAVGQKVLEGQGSVNADLVRHTKGSIR